MNLANEQVIKLFEQALAEAEKGQIQFGVYIGCCADSFGKPSPQFAVAWQGGGAYEAATYHATTCEQLRLRLAKLKDAA